MGMRGWMMTMVEGIKILIRMDWRKGEGWKVETFKERRMAKKLERAASNTLKIVSL